MRVFDEMMKVLGYSPSFTQKRKSDTQVPHNRKDNNQSLLNTRTRKDLGRYSWSGTGGRSSFRGSGGRQVGDRPGRYRVNKRGK